MPGNKPCPGWVIVARLYRPGRDAGNYPEVSTAIFTHLESGKRAWVIFYD
jgi:hypothetical protein